MDTSSVLFAFLLTFMAGISTGIGSLLAFFTKRTNTRLLSVALGFSAGVMIYVSFMEIIVQAQESLVSHWGAHYGTWATVLSFFGGIAVIAIIDKFVPSDENPHELKNMGQEGAAAAAIDPQRLHRTGIFTALAIGIHNFPEGMATFVAAIAEPNLGVAIAVAIAIHNIPEGIAVSMPIFYATGDRKKAFRYSFLSGLAEPIGAIIGYLILMPFMSPAVFGVLFAGVAGIMVYISLDELLPAAEEYGEHHLCIYGAVSGMGVMALSLLLLA